MKISRGVRIPLLIGLIGMASGGWLLQRSGDTADDVQTQAELFEEVLHHISARYVDERDPAELYRMAIEGLLRELGDPHTAFMTPEDYENLRISTTGEYGGLGIQIAVRNDWVTVIAPLPGTPAERAGMQAGDRIVRVDGESTRGWTEDKAVAELRGPRGSTVQLQVARLGVEEPLDVSITREEIHVQSVRNAFMMENGIGYIGLNVFSTTSTDEVRSALEQLQRQGMRGLILDLRTNPGGLLEQSVMMSDLFLEDGERIAEIRGRTERDRQSFEATTPDQYPGLPIVVLVNNQSASASEILAGALQDHDRALVIGETTFGKGSVQTLYELENDYHLKLTTARWYTPSGRSIQKLESEDDIVVFDEEEVSPNSPAPDASAVELVDEDAEAETYRTDAGRIVYGGGGIRPDLIVRDTLDLDERSFYGQVAEKYDGYMDAKYRWVLSYAHDNAELRQGFRVTDAMLESFWDELVEAGIDVERDAFDAARDPIARQLGYEITQTRWDAEAARRRENAYDPAVQLAERILLQADDPESIFAVADRVAAQTEDVQSDDEAVLGEER